MKHTMQPAKLLITIVPRDKGQRYVSVTKAAGARGGTIAYGRTSEGSRLMQLLSLADIHQEIVFTLLGPEKDQVIDAVVEAAHKHHKKHYGLALVLDVSGKIIRKQPEACPNTENVPMESGYTLITVIVNNGYADDVMVAARKAGATGGTILTARGTGTEEDVRFFGISLVPEKEMLLIVAEKGKAEAITEAIGDTPHLCEPGGGIVYTQTVEQFIILGK